MNEILHANIFFVIASVATVVFIVLTSIILFNIIKITRLIRSILTRVDEGSAMLARDIADLRSFMTGGGIMSWFVNLFFKKEDKSKTKTIKKNTTKRSAVKRKAKKDITKI